jgi:ribosomal protein S18 acetylase RimI-like enzyme
MSTVTIREAVESDRTGIWTIFQDVVRTGDTYPYAPDVTEQEALSRWMNADHSVYVAEDNRAIVGTYYMRPNQPDLGGHIANAAFMVLPGYQTKGVGREMARHALETAKNNGYKGMLFDFVVSTSHTAVDFWRRLGFVIIGTLPEAFKHQQHGLVDVYLMYKQL